MKILCIKFDLINANGGVLNARLDPYLDVHHFNCGPDGSYTAKCQGRRWQAEIVAGFFRIVAEHSGKASLRKFRTFAKKDSLNEFSLNNNHLEDK